MINLIGITGYKGSGKDEVGKMLQYLEFHRSLPKPGLNISYQSFKKNGGSTGQPWRIKKFALKLKLMMCAFLNCTLEDLETEEFKKKIIFGKSVRYMLQTIGTEWGRNLIDENVWVDSLFMNWEPDSNWIVTDVRFHNEVAAILGREGVMIKVNRFENKDLHASEIQIPDLIINYEIDNAGTLEELFRQVEKVYLKIRRL